MQTQMHASARIRSSVADSKSSLVDAAASLCEGRLLRPWPEAAERLGVSRTVIFRFMRTGELATVRLPDGHRRIAEGAIEAFKRERLVVRDAAIR